jgi:hypothetical protein
VSGVLEEVHEVILADGRDYIWRLGSVKVFAVGTDTLRRWDGIFFADVDEGAFVYFEFYKFDAGEGAKGDKGQPIGVHWL